MKWTTLTPVAFAGALRHGFASASCATSGEAKSLVSAADCSATKLMADCSDFAAATAAACSRSLPSYSGNSARNFAWAA